MDIEELRERLIDLWETQRTKLILGAGVLVCSVGIKSQLQYQLIHRR